jgi:hypothetical protein
MMKKDRSRDRWEFALNHSANKCFVPPFGSTSLGQKGSEYIIPFTEEHFVIGSCQMCQDNTNR